MNGVNWAMILAIKSSLDSSFTTGFLTGLTGAGFGFTTSTTGSISTTGALRMATKFG
jgi:hypothetical protein